MQMSDIIDIHCGTLTFGSNTSLREHVIFRINGGKVKIGNNVFINDGCEINCHNCIVLEDGVLLGQNVLIYDHDHNYKAGPIHRRTEFITSPVIIGSNAWIGSNVVILKGVKIGKNSVVAAGSIVLDDVPDDCVFYNLRVNRIKKIGD